MGTSNAITADGMDAVTELLLLDVADPTDGQFDFIGIGTGTTPAAVGDSALGTQQQRSAGTGTQQTTTQTNDTAQLTHQFSFGGSFAITEAGVFNHATNTLLLSRCTFDAVNVTSADTLDVTYKIQVKQGV
jgi:hypothetical protein